jgi:hypothetical protein
MGLPRMSGEGDGVACEFSDVDKGFVEPVSADLLLLLLLLLSKKVVVVYVGGGFISPLSTTELVVDFAVDVDVDAAAVDPVESSEDEEDGGGSLSCGFPLVRSELVPPPPPNLDIRWSRSCCGVS